MLHHLALSSSPTLPKCSSTSAKTFSWHHPNHTKVSSTSTTPCQSSDPPVICEHFTIQYVSLQKCSSNIHGSQVKIFICCQGNHHLETLLQLKQLNLTCCNFQQVTTNIHPNSNTFMVEYISRPQPSFWIFMLIPYLTSFKILTSMLLTLHPDSLTILYFHMHLSLSELRLCLQ